MANKDVLKALLDASEKPEKVVHMKRIGLDFKLQALDGKRISKIQEQATQYIGKGSNRRKEVDEEQFSALIIKEATLEPDFGASELVEKFGTPADAIQNILLAGELAKLSGEIMELSGFGDEEEEEVKNS